MREHHAPDPLLHAIADFRKRAKDKAREYDLRIEDVTDSGVRASRGDLLFEFTQDGGELVVALASRLRPERYYAAEYVAAMLGGLAQEDLARYSQLLDKFVAREDPDAEPPPPLATTDQLLTWARKNADRLDEEFCRNPRASSKLDRLVERYLTGPAAGHTYNEPSL